MAVKQIQASKEYKESTGANDIGIVVLATALKFNDKIKSIAIPNPKARSTSNEGPAKIAGKKSKVLTPEECKKKFGTSVPKDKACASVSGSANCKVFRIMALLNNFIL